ncbi:MAG: hypothetical protein ABIT36_09215 [Steroidobacteraceae bacterium]
MANQKPIPSQAQTQTWTARNYDGKLDAADPEDDDELDMADYDGIPSSTPDESTLELDTGSDGDLADLEIMQRANEEIIGDTGGEDYRAGTVDPDGSDRGPSALSSQLIEEDEDARRNGVSQSDSQAH